MRGWFVWVFVCVWLYISVIHIPISMPIYIGVSICCLLLVTTTLSWPTLSLHLNDLLYTLQMFFDGWIHTKYIIQCSIQSVLIKSNQTYPMSSKVSFSLQNAKSHFIFPFVTGPDHAHSSDTDKVSLSSFGFYN